MMRKRSFTEYIKNNYYCELRQAVDEYIQAYSQTLVSKSNVLKTGLVTLKSVEIMKVYAGDKRDMAIDFDVLVRVGVSIWVFDDEFENQTLWLRICCDTALGGETLKIHIGRIEKYDRQKNWRFKDKLTDQLIPILSSKNLDDEAKIFLENFYPDALEKPQAINPYWIADKMGLKVRKTKITKDFRVDGQLYFYEGHLESGEMIPAQTILLDLRIGSSWRLKHTLIHECVHWNKHQKAFELERLFNPNLVSLNAQNNRINGKLIQGSLAWMEWQAKAMAPRILMPAQMFALEAERLLKQQNSIEIAIDQIAKKFDVSRLSAKIRMVELGYQQAIGAFNYVDGQYVPAHSWREGFLKYKQTFCIDRQSVMRELQANPAFLKLISSGLYVYVASHFVLNLPEYVVYDSHGPVGLTAYARAHMDEE